MNNEINLLVIDDDEINIFIMKKIMEKTGHNAKMISKTNGKLAIEYLAELINNDLPLPNLILVDINMPVLNGWEFLEQYKTLNIMRNIDMYMLSSSIYENDMEKAKIFKSVKGFISKPLSIEHLTEIFESIGTEAI